VLLQAHFNEHSMSVLSGKVHRYFSPGGFILSAVEGRPDFTASTVLQRMRGGGTTGSCAAPCICSDLGS
jgi:hypothetical protein